MLMLHVNVTFQHLLIHYWNY